MTLELAPRVQARVPTVETKPVQRVVVGVEGVGGEELVQEQAALFAAALGVSVLGLHVHDPGRPPRNGVFTYLERQCGRLGVRFMAQPMPGTDAGDEIVAELDASDLCVLGTRRLGSRYHTGSVAKKVLDAAPGPVQLVRLP